MNASLTKVVSNPVQAMEKVMRGLDWDEANQLARWLDLPIAKLGQVLQISPATMTRRRKSRFDPPESDRILRFARLWLLACDAVGGPEGARSWLKRPQYGLNGAVPIEMARFETGAREVESLLRRILYGILA
jgi:putative toxin-antitoxin system antitoxin component (TIGR02293 family)